MLSLKPLSLRGKYCSLEPLSHEHHDGLIEAVKEGELWNLWYTLIPRPENMNDEINKRLDLQAQGSMIPFTIIDNATNKAVGMTAYLNIDPTHCRLEMGGTWMCQTKQRSGINTDAKFLMLRHAFETLTCNAVEFRTHFFNQQSRRAIERLGAKLDGVLRNHMIMPDKTLRDTCVYSIISNEWPSVKAHFTWLISKHERLDR